MTSKYHNCRCFSYLVLYPKDTRNLIALWHWCPKNQVPWQTFDIDSSCAHVAIYQIIHSEISRRCRYELSTPHPWKCTANEMNEWNNTIIRITMGTSTRTIEYTHKMGVASQRIIFLEAWAGFYYTDQNAKKILLCSLARQSTLVFFIGLLVISFEISFFYSLNFLFSISENAWICGNSAHQKSF